MRATVLLVAVLLAACGDNEPPIPPDDAFSVLVFTKQNEWMHASNPVAAQAIKDLGTKNGWYVVVSDDPGVFNPPQLAHTNVVIFSVTSANILNAGARANLEAFFQGGGGFVGIHSASHTEWDWPFYLSSLVPVTFETHPSPVNVQQGRLTIESQHPITADIPNPWVRSDEYYTFYQRPENIPGLQMLVALDESSMGPDYNPPKIGYHPLAFTHELSGGRTFYTALGHTPESYSEPAFMTMLEHGIEWAGNLVP